MATNKTDLSAEQRRLVHLYYRELRDFSTVTGGKLDRSSSARAQKARSKLLKLYSSQFFELSTDVHDELQRRIDENQTQPDHLLPKDNFHVKRNQARQKLANLSESRFNDLVDDILYEIQRRDYHKLPEPQTPISPKVSPLKDSFRSEEGEEDDPNVSSQSVVHTDPRNSDSRGSALVTDNDQNVDNSTPKKSSFQNDSTTSSSIVPSTSIQQSQVIPKKASIEWSSDEEEDHQDAEKQNRSPLKPIHPGSSEDKDGRRLSEGHELEHYSGSHNNITDFASRSQLLQDSDKSDFESDLQSSPHFGAGKSQRPFHAPSGSSQMSSPEHTKGQPGEDISLEETEGLSLMKRSSQLHSTHSNDSEANEERSRDSGNLSGAVARDTMEHSEVGTPKSKQDLSPTFDSPPKGSHLKFASEPNSSNGFKEPISWENDEDRPNTIASATSNNSPFNTRERSESGHGSRGLQAQPKHLGSIKRISLENENSQREIRVLIAEGTKMDEKITKLEKDNAQLSAAKKNLENELHLQENQSSALEEQLDGLTKKLRDAKRELEELKTVQISENHQNSRSTDRTHHQEFLNMTNQVNNLSIENEKLKQDLAEMEFKLKKNNCEDKSSNAKGNATSKELSNGTNRSEALEKIQSLPRKFLSPEGLIPPDLLTSFNSKIENMFSLVNGDRQDADFGHQLFDVLSHIVTSVQKLLEIVDSRGSQEHILILKGALSHAITSVRFFASYHEILPLVTVNSAVSDVAFALCQIVESVKVASKQGENLSSEKSQYHIPQTPNAQNWPVFQDTKFQDPRETFQGLSNNPGNMSPVKPLKITQKVVQNSPPSKGRHTSRKPSSTLFGSIVNPSPTANNSPESVQFPKIRSGSPARKQEGMSSPIAVEKTHQSQKPSAVTPAPAREIDAVLPPTSPSHIVSSQGKQVINSDVPMKDLENSSSTSMATNLERFDGKNAEKLQAAVEKVHEASSDEESTDGQERNNDDSNLTSDDDLTYQLKQNLLKNQKPKEALDNGKTITGDNQSKVSPQPPNLMGQDAKGLEVPAKSGKGREVITSSHSTNKLSFVPNAENTSTTDSSNQGKQIEIKKTDAKHSIADDRQIAEGTQPSKPQFFSAKGPVGDDNKQEHGVANYFSKQNSVASTRASQQNFAQQTPAKQDTDMPKETSPRESPKMNLNESPKISVKESSNTNLRESPKMNLNESPKMNLNESPKMNLNESPKISVKESSSTKVKENQNTNVKENQNTNVKESPNTNVKESPNTNVKESLNTNVKESLNTNVKESPSMNQRESLKVNLKESLNTNSNERSETNLNGSPKTFAARSSFTDDRHELKREFTPLDNEHTKIKLEDRDDWNTTESRSRDPKAASSMSAEEVNGGGRDSVDEGDFDIDAFDIENPDNTLSELLLYLEHRTIEVISTIQSLLTSIKQPQALKGELCKDSSAINQVIAQMVEATNVSMAQSRNAALKEHGNWVVQSLKDCKRRMTSLCHLNEDGTISFDEGDDEYASKHFKQRLAGIAFDVAKCTKELVKTVEEASLKEEIEYLNSQLKR
ncbi:LAFA_0E17568g1_1 [Lachancea sp. 'fantastica']|nr:LAFA_0E17568g1_1 [Lachancea sp. 'fantastica']